MEPELYYAASDRPATVPPRAFDYGLEPGQWWLWVASGKEFTVESIYDVGDTETAEVTWFPGGRIANIRTSQIYRWMTSGLIVCTGGCL